MSNKKSHAITRFEMRSPNRSFSLKKRLFRTTDRNTGRRSEKITPPPKTHPELQALQNKQFTGGFAEFS